MTRSLHRQAKLAPIRPGSRLAQALQVRTWTLAVIKVRGVMEEIQGVKGRVQTCNLDSLSMSHYTPFQRLHVPTPEMLRQMALLKQMTGRGPSRNLEYGLDIWSERGKVLNIEWSTDDKEVALIRFKRGTWEDTLRLAAAALVG